MADKGHFQPVEVSGTNKEAAMADKGHFQPLEVSGGSNKEAPMPDYKQALMAGLTYKDLGVALQEAAASQAESKFRKAEEYNTTMRIRAEERKVRKAAEEEIENLDVHASEIVGKDERDRATIIQGGYYGRKDGSMAPIQH